MRNAGALLALVGRWWGWGQWLLIPLAVFWLTESAFRSAFDRVPLWYGAAEWAASEGRVDVVFIGSSRVSAAVNVTSFAREVFVRTGQCPRGLNLGQGYSTDPEHYLGLRNLLTSHPESLQGVVVFVEAAGGLPSSNGGWDTSWVHSAQPWLVVDLLRSQDLLPLWRSRGLAISEKLHLTLRFGLRKVSSALNRRERIREGLLEGGIGWLLHLSSGHIGSNPFMDVPVHYGLLGGGGGLRTGREAFSRAREAAFRFTSESLRNEQPIREWGTSVLSDLVQLVRRHGGQVVFFEMPVSSVFGRLYATPLRQEDIRIFREQAKIWGTPVLLPQLAFSDRDFPDLWHLDSRAASVFSEDLARAWVEDLRTTGKVPNGNAPHCPR